MFIIQSLQNDGSWWGFRYGAITGEPARFNSEREARFAYISFKGSVGAYGKKWRVVKLNPLSTRFDFPAE